jgi:hypothetical protein
MVRKGAIILMKRTIQFFSILPDLPNAAVDAPKICIPRLAAVFRMEIFGDAAFRQANGLGNQRNR